jgi:hypothetical protein
MGFRKSRVPRPNREFLWAYFITKVIFLSISTTFLFFTPPFYVKKVLVKSPEHIIKSMENELHIQVKYRSSSGKRK